MKPDIRLYMEVWKRNQMEAAISVVSGQGPRPSAKLRTKLKRLLDTDRALDHKPRAKNPALANYAFYGGKAPGRGSEVWFSSYEVFALLEAYQLMEHGLPQATAVSALRQARPVLEPKHAEILQWDPHELFNEQKIVDGLRPGSIAVWSTRPVYLLLVRKASRKDGSSDAATGVEVLEESEISYSRWPPGTSMTMIELTRTAHNLRDALAKTKPSKRGRGSL
jgi:hypothetical protein